MTQVFLDIAQAIRDKGQGSDEINPLDMGNAIRALCGIEERELPDANLPDVFQDIADAIRECGVLGTMTPLEMP